MNIGITYDLKSDYLKRGYSQEETAELDSEETIESIDSALKKLGHLTEKIGGARRLFSRLMKGKRWDLVFNIAEGLKGYGRESLIPALLDSYSIPYTFSDPAVLALTLHKEHTKHMLVAKGIQTPVHKLVRTMEDLDDFSLPFPVFAKPVSEGSGKGISRSSKITSLAALKRICFDLLILFDQPVLVEEYLPGREFTVGIIGTGMSSRVLGVMEVSMKQEDQELVYSRYNKDNCEKLIRYELSTDQEAYASGMEALKTWRTAGCRDAGRVDIRLDSKGTPNIMEINPLAGLHPSHSDLPIINSLSGRNYDLLISEIIHSAAQRVPEIAYLSKVANKSFTLKQNKAA